VEIAGVVPGDRMHRLAQVGDGASDHGFLVACRGTDDGAIHGKVSDP